MRMCKHLARSLPCPVDLLISFYVCDSSVYMLYMCARYMPAPLWGQKKASDFLELEFMVGCELLSEFWVTL